MHNKLPPRSSVTKFSITMYNDTVDMLAWWRKEQRFTGSNLIRTTKQSGIIWVQNDSGQDLDQFDLLGLDVPLILPGDNLPEFSKQVTFSGIVPDSDEHRGKFCVIQQPLATGKMGRAVVSGVTPARVEINDEADEYADIQTSEPERLDSGGSGARIVWKPGGTGEQLCTVRLGDMSWEREFELKDNLPASGSVAAGQQATVHPVNPGGTVDTAADREFEVYDRRGVFRGRAKDKYSSPHDQGSRGIARWSPSIQKWFIRWMQPHATEIKGTLTGDLVKATGTFTISSISVRLPVGGIITDTDPAANATIQNRAYDGDSGSIVYATWDEEEADRFALDVICPA